MVQNRVVHITRRTPAKARWPVDISERTNPNENKSVRMSSAGRRLHVWKDEALAEPCHRECDPSMGRDASGLKVSKPPITAAVLQPAEPCACRI
jgi:hypothetical protein